MQVPVHVLSCDLVFLEVRVPGHWGAVILYKKVLLDQGSGPKGVCFLIFYTVHAFLYTRV